ncbi:hypothetical protein [Mesorhizobium sp. M1273]|uniref:hypothetical protein n=1 Tax=Mesorhizobium sp. M1273 TaxID=2957075 RepID=UPI003339B926
MLALWCERESRFSTSVISAPCVASASSSAPWPWCNGHPDAPEGSWLARVTAEKPRMQVGQLL